MNRTHSRDVPSGTIPGARSGRWRRPLAWAVAVAASASLAVVAALAFGPGGSRPGGHDPLATTPTGPDFERPSDWSPYRPAMHLTPGQHWMNDPQRPFWLDGRWHYYYLYNADYPDGNGTEWYHATSTDLVHWREEGVAIEKYENGLGDIETGSAVIDTEDTAGFGAGAVIAILTQQDEGIQRQSMFVSTDGGYSFEPYEGNPVIDNPGEPHFRDPKIVWDDERHEWLMVLAEGHKIGFYTSPDLKGWTYRSGFERNDLGVLECPDLFEMSVDGDPSDTRWVLVTGANGADRGMTTGTAYWTGEWDGEAFTTDAADPLWLDRGSDFYAAVTWDDPRADPADRLASRYAIGWLNNWGYASELPTEDWHGGADSIVRELTLTDRDGRPALVSTPVGGLASLEGTSVSASGLEVPDGAAPTLPQPTSDAYRLRLDLRADDGDNTAREVRFRVKEGDGSFATIGVDFATGIAFVARDADATAARMPSVYREVRTAPAPPRQGRVTLDVIVDASSVEVYVNGGEQVLSSLVFGAPGANGVSVESVGGTTIIESLRLTPLAVAPVDRAGPRAAN